MENAIYIDFSIIDDINDFYQQLKEKVSLPEHFGDNLDALNDVLTGDVELPMHIEFVNMNLMQLDIFEDLLELMEDIANEIEGFTFTYYLEIYDSDEEWDWVDESYDSEEE